MKTIAVGFFLLFCTTANFGQTGCSTNDPWFSLGCGGYGARGNGTPVITFTDASGSPSQAIIYSAGHHATQAVSGMYISVDTSIEPEMLSGGASQSNCTAHAVCIQNRGTGGTGSEAGQFTSASSPITGPTTAYFKIACTSATTVSGLTPINTGRWSREFVVTAAGTGGSGAQKLTIFSPVCSTLTCNGGHPPTCPNALTSMTTGYVVALAVDPVYSPLPGAWWPGMSSGTEMIQAVMPMGADFTICSSGCTQSSVTISGNPVPGLPQQQTFPITGTGHTSGGAGVIISGTLQTTFGQNIPNVAVYGYDDAPAIGSWLTSVTNSAYAGSGATGYCPPGSYLWNTANGPISWLNSSSQVYTRITGAGRAGNFGTQATSQQGTCEFVTIGTNTALSLNPPPSANTFGGAEISNISFREGIPGVLGPSSAPIYDNLGTGMIFQDLSFTNYENTAGIIIAGTSTSFAQYNDIVRPLWSDVQTGVLFTGLTADNRIWGGRFFGSRVGGGATINSQGPGAGYTWVYGTNCQYAPVCYKQIDQAGASVEMKAENTYGLNTSTASMIGSSGTGTFAVFDGTSTANCLGNHVSSEQIGFFHLGLYNSANCTSTQVGMFRFKQTTTQYNDNSSYPLFLTYSITVPPLARAWTTGTNINNVVLCVANDGAGFRLTVRQASIEWISQSSCRPQAPAQAP